jgi:Skp family chaperone for outer membrane proteins
MQRVVWSCLVLLTAGSLAAQTPPAPPPPAPPSAPPSAPPAAPPARPSSTALKIAFIRSQEILSQTPGFATAESTLAREIAGFRAEVEKLQRQMDSATTAFDQQAIALSPAAKQTKQRELQALAQRFQQRSGQLQDQAAQRQQELLAPINARIRAIIDGIRAEGNYSIIFDVDAPGGVLVAADPALNITARVIQRLQGSQ